MNLYEANTTAELLRNWILARPNKGRGELRRLSQKTGIHTTTMSQVVKGTRLLSLEQASSLSGFLALGKVETKFFLTLLQKERAGSESLKRYFAEELAELRAKGQDLVHVVKKDKTLNEGEKARFYSNWYYSGLAVLSSLPSLNSPTRLMEYTGLGRDRVHEILSFLLSSGILKESRGKLQPGATATHLESTSPFIGRHHGNWRVKAMERHPNLGEEELAYSSPVSLSLRDAKRVRALLAKLVQETSHIVGPSPCETAYCLNIDWFRL